MIDQARTGLAERATLALRQAGDWVAANRSHWLRGLLMLAFLLVLWVVRLVVALAALFQFGALLITDAPNEQVRRFGASLALYTAEIVAYLTCASEQIPFPVGRWPRPVDHQEPDAWE